MVRDMDEKTLEQLIGKLEKKELLKLIGQIVQTNSAAEHDLLVFCQKISTPANSDLIVGKLLLKHWQNAHGIISDANEYGGCSDEDEGDADWELEEITKLVQANDILWEYRKAALDEMLVQIDHDNSGFTDSLVDLAELFCQTDSEKAYLADFLAKGGSSYYKKYAATIYKNLGDLEKSLNIRKDNLEYGSDYLAIAKYYDDHGDHKTALKYALDGLDQSSGWKDEIYQYLFKYYVECKNEKALGALYEKALKKQRDLDCIAELMYRYCKQKGDYQGQKNMLIKLLETCNESEILKWYKQCRQDFKPEDWQKEESTISQQVKNKSIKAYLDLCLEMGNKKEVLEIVLHPPRLNFFSSIDSGHRYSKMLVDDYPNEILQLYWGQVHSLINEGQDKNYRKAASTLKEIKSSMLKYKLAAEWKKKLNELKETYKRRRNFLREIVNL